MLVDALRDELFIFSGIEVHRVPEVERIFQGEKGVARQEAAAYALDWFVEHYPDLVDEEVRETLKRIGP